VTVTATLGNDSTSTSGHVFVPKTPELFTHDADDNLLTDGRWNYTWDAENRLVRVESRPDTPQTSWRRVEWTYDPLGRRIRQTTSVWTNNAWAVVEDLKFISDPLLFGRHIAELNAGDNALVRSYVWGLDLSGSLDGAGGVGGLLWVTLHTGSGPAAGTHFAAYDGNGNIVALSAASDGSESARYEYGPFGEPIRVTGPAAALNPFRFSTKRVDPTTDLVLYEYRAYSPTRGGWLSRDPLGEWAGPQLYAFAANTPVGSLDLLGLAVERRVGNFTIVITGKWEKPGSVYRKVPGTDFENCTCADAEIHWTTSGTVQINATILETGVQFSLSLSIAVSATAKPQKKIWLEIRVDIKTGPPPGVELGGWRVMGEQAYCGKSDTQQLLP